MTSVEYENGTCEHHLPDAEYEPLECMQYPGDVVYVPLHWGHAVLNAQDSIGLAVEFSMKHDDQYNQ